MTGATGSLPVHRPSNGWCNGEQAAEKIQVVPVSDCWPLRVGRSTSLLHRPDGHLFERPVHRRGGEGQRHGLVSYQSTTSGAPTFWSSPCGGVRHPSTGRAGGQRVPRRGALMGSTQGSASPRGSLYYNENVVQYPMTGGGPRRLCGEGLFRHPSVRRRRDDLAIAEIIRNGLTAAGIEVAVEAHDSATRDGRINSGDSSSPLVGTGGWGNNPPPTCAPCSPTSPSSPAPNPHSHGAISYSNAETRVGRGQVYETDFDKRVELFQELELLVSREIPIIVIANQSLLLHVPQGCL